MRRDVSNTPSNTNNNIGFSLHAQRCFQGEGAWRKHKSVFSACAEMFPLKADPATKLDSFLCMRRDVSYSSWLQQSEPLFSLHAQRCFLSITLVVNMEIVFSACAEMFLSVFSSVRGNSGFLCMRRDVSYVVNPRNLSDMFSLHAQRCFLCWIRKVS